MSTTGRIRVKRRRVHWTMEPQFPDDADAPPPGWRHHARRQAATLAMVVVLVLAFLGSLYVLDRQHERQEEEARAGAAPTR